MLLEVHLALLDRFGVIGVAAASVVGAWINVTFLYLVLLVGGHYRMPGALLLRIARIVISAAAMGVAIMALASLWGPLFGGSVAERVWSVALLVGAGGAVYFGLAWLTGAIDRRKIGMLTRKSSIQD